MGIKSYIIFMEWFYAYNISIFLFYFLSVSYYLILWVIIFSDFKVYLNGFDFINSILHIWGLGHPRLTRW